MEGLLSIGEREEEREKKGRGEWKMSNAAILSKRPSLYRLLFG